MYWTGLRHLSIVTVQKPKHKYLFPFQTQSIYDHWNINACYQFDQHTKESPTVWTDQLVVLYSSSTLLFHRRVVLVSNKTGHQVLSNGVIFLFIITVMIIGIFIAIIITLQFIIIICIISISFLLFPFILYCMLINNRKQSSANVFILNLH